MDNTAISLNFQDYIPEHGATTNAQILVDAAGSGDLRIVLDAMAQFLRLAGFQYVVALGAELDNGEVRFNDDGFGRF